MGKSNNLQTIGNGVLGYTEKWLKSVGVNPEYTDELKFIVIAILLVLTCVLVDFVVKQVMLKVIHRLVSKTKTDWDDIMMEKRVFHNLAHLAPALVLESLIPVVFAGHSNWIYVGLKLGNLYLIGGFIILMISLVKTIQVVLARHPFLQDKPIDSYMQVVRIIIYILGGIYLIATLFDKSPWGIFSALGAMSVVLLLVFKDTILGFVASIQLAANDMVKLGDNVEFPKYGADGEIIEIKLQTIKIRNGDKTITSVPTYAFVSEAFKNFRGIKESGGKRIKRSIIIDITTIKFCDHEMLERYGKIQFIQEYLDAKKLEIEEYNQQKDIDFSSVVNGRHLSNIGTFRAYVTAYLKNNDKIHQELPLVVRQMQPTEYGLPIEIYCFSRELALVDFEGIQADIFDHIFSIVEEFDLKVFQMRT